MDRSHLIAMAVATACAVASSPVYAQSEGETVFYLLKRIEEGDSPRKGYAFTKVSDNPFRIEAKTETGSTDNWTVNKISNCKYEVRETTKVGSEIRSATTYIDMSKSSPNLTWSREQLLDIVYFYSFSRDKKSCVKIYDGMSNEPFECVLNMDRRTYEERGGKKRIDDAYAHLKANYCKGKAY